ncbi:anti-sigma factor antagonist [Streptomyces sp. SID5594]|uniref:STAS domain-containing protein n=1 Tax=Streptomyces TaxID=1883 RepID=UPI00037058B1|nr:MULTISPECIES: STAS domain-containing protein [Streptomyces]MZF54733.1 anti-sigma factor antagonist [Streptomyces sp. SID5594]WRO08197.1 STAS domain-containing protein [Streptomyces cyaneofuscatus]
MQERRLDDLLVRITEYTRPNACVLALLGSTGAWNTPALEHAFHAAAATERPLVVDLTGLYFGDEVLLGILIQAHASIRGLVLINPATSSFARRLHRTGVEELFNTQHTLSLALAQLPGRPRLR